MNGFCILGRVLFIHEQQYICPPQVHISCVFVVPSLPFVPSYLVRFLELSASTQSICLPSFTILFTIYSQILIPKVWHPTTMQQNLRLFLPHAARTNYTLQRPTWLCVSNQVMIFSNHRDMWVSLWIALRFLENSNEPSLWSPIFAAKRHLSTHLSFPQTWPFFSAILRAGDGGIPSCKQRSRNGTRQRYPRAFHHRIHDLSQFQYSKAKSWSFWIYPSMD